MSALNHWDSFARFCSAELATGGPDPQLTVLEHIGRPHSHIERVWLAGCYGAHHCLPSAVAVWERFRPGEVCDGSANLLGFLEKWWDHLPVRPEMRSHRMVEKRHACLVGFALYAIQEHWVPENNLKYNDLWRDSIDKIPFYNRYMAIKYLEMLRKMVNPTIEIPDMRAKGGWSPRKTLALLHPDKAHILGDKERNSKEDVALTEEVAMNTRMMLMGLGVTVSMFQLQVLLCEYKEALAGGYYPGASLDEELGYIRRSSIFAPHKRIFEARRESFPHEHLGELGGWDDIRKEKYLEWK
jgi:hypothetical protein